MKTKKRKLTIYLLSVMLEDEPRGIWVTSGLYENRDKAFKYAMSTGRSFSIEPHEVKR